METNPPRNSRLELVDADERREQGRCLFPAFLYPSDRQIPHALKNSPIEPPRSGIHVPLFRLPSIPAGG